VGRVRVLPDGRVGKFGWKAQVATLREFVARACATELGLGNPLMEQDRPLGKPEYPSVKRDLDGEQFAALVAYVDSLPRPRETLPTDVNKRAQAVHGKQLFVAIGCATCHTPDLGGLKGVYSDFLLYVLEPPGSPEGGFYQDTAQELPPGLLPLPEGHALPEEWKTPPLWGVADSAPYFHDGKSPTLADAILRHGGEAASVTRGYQRLSHEEQEAIIVFLKTLTAPLETEGSGEPDFADGRDGALAEISKLGGAIELDENSPGKPVVRLNLTGKLVSDIDLVHLGGLAQLRALELSQTQVTDAGLARLIGLTKLRQLDLSINVLTDAGLAHLRSLSQLRALNLRFTLISDAGLAHLKDLPQLQVLKLDGTQVTAEGLKHLRGRTRLQELDLSATKVTDTGLEHLQGFTELRELGLTSTRVGNWELRHLKGLTELQRLGLNSTGMGDEGLDHVRGLINLQRLELEGCMVTDSGLARLEGLTELQELDISRTQVTDVGMQHVGGLSNLRALRLVNTRLTDAGLSHLRRLTRLQTLDLRGTEVSDEGLRYLKELTHLQKLGLWRTRVTEGGAKHLQREMPNVTILR
jgi:Leucine-rich repeat (LRR) protein